MGASIRTRLTLATAALTAGTAALVLSGVYLATISGLEANARRAVKRELDSLVDHWNENGLEGLAELVTQRANDPDHDGFAYLVAQEGRVRIAGNVREWPEDHPSKSEGKDTFLELRQADAWIVKHVHLESVPIGDHQLLVGRDTSDDDALIAILGEAALGGLALATVLAVAAGLGVSRNLLGRLETMQIKIASILHGARKERVTIGSRGDEFDEFAAQFNQLLDENDRLLAQARDATNNIAHDLRTPLSRMHGRLESALSTEQTTPENRELLEALSADTHRLLDTFNGLLQIARVEGRELRRSMESIRVDSLLEDVVDLYGPLAEDAGLAIHVAVPPGLEIKADRQLLGQALANLIDNAMKYAPDAECIEVEAQSEEGGVEISVSDHGPGIPEPDRARVLDRLVRLDSSRAVPGSGLGLSLVAAVAQLHGGTVELEDNGPGLRCVLRLAADPMDGAAR